MAGMLPGPESPRPRAIGHQKSKRTEADSVRPLIERARTIPLAGIDPSSASVILFWQGTGSY